MEQSLLDQLHRHLSSPHRAAAFARALLSNPHTSTSTRDATLSALATATSASTSSSSFLAVAGAHLDEDLALSLVSSPSFAVRSRVAELLANSSALRPEAAIRVLLWLASDLYPSVRATALGGLAAVLEKAEAAGEGEGSDEVVECCYGCAVELLRDEEESARLAAVRLVNLCAEKFTARDETMVGGDKMDVIFVQLSSMARDMSVKVRVEAFNALGRSQQASQGVLLQSLSKKVIRTDTGSSSLSKGKKQPSKLIFPCAAGIFAHGIEDEFCEVRTVACKSLGMLAKFSTQYAEKALDLLMDMMNDDSEAVRLQTLQTLFHMGTFGCLNVQQKHMHMFLGLLLDFSVLIRSAARKILRLVNLSKLQMFKSAIDGLITCLEKHPEEEEDIYGVLLSVGKNHGSFAANIAKHLATEIGTMSDGELILDKPRIKALLVLSISAPLSDKHNTFDIPVVIFSHAIPLLGRISCALGEAIDQDSLLAYLCHRSGMPFLDKKLVSTGAEAFEICNGETVGEIGAHTEQSKKKSNCLDEVLLLQATKFILDTVEGAWSRRKSCSTYEVRTILRTCKEELQMLASNSSGSTSAFLSFLCEFVDATQLIVEIWQLMQLENSCAFGITSLDVLLEKLDISLRRMKYCFVGLTRELEVHILELALLADLFRLSKVGICSDLLLDKVHSIINRLEVLCAEGSCELSDFTKELKKAINAKCIGNASNGNICNLLELFHLRPTTNFGTLKAITAELRVLDNDSENPLSYVSGLPVGISFGITLHNTSSHDRLWLRMVVGESIQYAFLEFCHFGGCDEVRSCSTVIPFYATPAASSFLMRVCLVMECPSESIRSLQDGHGGPKDCIVQLCDECTVYFVNIGKR